MKFSDKAKLVTENPASLVLYNKWCLAIVMKFQHKSMPKIHSYKDDTNYMPAIDISLEVMGFDT